MPWTQNFADNSVQIGGDKERDMKGALLSLSFSLELLVSNRTLSKSV